MKSFRGICCCCIAGFRVGLASTFCFCIPRIPRKCLLSIFYLRKHFAVPRSTVKNCTFSWPVHCLQLLFPVPSTLSKNYPLPCPVHCSTIVICRGQYTVKQVFYISRAQYTVKKLQFAVVCTLSQIVHCCGQCTVKLLICRG